MSQLDVPRLGGAGASRWCPWQTSRSQVDMTLWRHAGPILPREQQTQQC